jgi:peptidylprolyl isomerase
VAPQNATRIRELAHENFFDGLRFFRVIENFMDQTGDPQNTGQGGSSKPNVPGEFTFRRGRTSTSWLPLTSRSPRLAS